MRLGRVFERFLGSRKKKSTPEDGKPENRYEYPVSSDDNIRFHTERVGGPDKIRDELKRTFPNLKEAVVTNLRLEHDTAINARDTVAEISKRNPQFVIVESMGAPAHSQSALNDYVQGRVNRLEDFRFSEFTAAFLRSLRQLKEGGFPVPLLVIADLPRGDDLLRDLSRIENMPDILTHGWGSFEEAKKHALQNVVAYNKATLERERYIVSNLPRKIHEIVRNGAVDAATLDVDSVEHLDIMALYGGSHGTLSKFFREDGARTAAVGQSLSLHPIEGMLRQVKFAVLENGELAEHAIDDSITDAIFAALIEAGIPKWKRDYTEYFGKVTQRDYENALAKVVRKWRVEALRRTGPSLEGLYAEAQKSESDFFHNRALPLMRGFLGLEERNGV